MAFSNSALFNAENSLKSDLEGIERIHLKELCRKLNLWLKSDLEGIERLLWCICFFAKAVGVAVGDPQEMIGSEVVVPFLYL
ncbi:hypothetical protein GACE_1981 [Geoglobus acetivorans]|uniref:Uncharacterized protein n=1 Tax=Geoglobus acetivorans TaxID=565033 RepID=A0A0A7GJA8_GEOAI|nr:hypothetical protein GACE_1981 [Geoglobus acetivorans]